MKQESGYFKQFGGRMASPNHMYVSPPTNLAKKVKKGCQLCPSWSQFSFDPAGHPYLIEEDPY